MPCLLFARIGIVPICSWKNWIRNIHAPANRIDPYIVRAVEQFASIIVYQHDMASIRMDLPYFSMHVRTRDEVAISVESHPVGAARALQEQSYLTGSGVPSIDPVIGLVSKEHVSMPINRGAFRKTKTFS